MLRYNQSGNTFRVSKRNIHCNVFERINPIFSDRDAGVVKMGGSMRFETWKNIYKEIENRINTGHGI